MSPLERAALLSHARSRGFARRLEATRELLADALSRHRPHVSLSGGKDSTVALHLAREADPSIPAAHFDSGGEHPATKEHVLSSFENVRVFLPRVSYIELLRIAYGSGVYIPSGELMRYIIEEPSERAFAELGTESYIIGLRAEESRGRRMSALAHGEVYEPEGGGGRARIAPLLFWSWKDVWAAMLLFDLPAHPAYAERLPGESLADMRVGVITDLASEHTPATLARLAHFDPAAYARLKALVPQAPWPI